MIHPTLKKIVLVVTVSPFPYGNAKSSRIRAFCQLFRYMGYSVHVIGLYTKQNQYVAGEIYKENGYSFEIISKKPLKSIDTFFCNRLFIPNINKFLKTNDVEFIFSDHCQCYFSSILKIAKLAKVPYFVEQCEKYDISSYKFKQLDIRYIKFLYLFKRGFKKANGIIAISRFLENHYKKQEIRIVRIPTILEIDKIPFSIDTCNKRIRLVYTGFAFGHKNCRSLYSGRHSTV